MCDLNSQIFSAQFNFKFEFYRQATLGNKFKYCKLKSTDTELKGPMKTSNFTLDKLKVA